MPNNPSDGLGHVLVDVGVIGQNADASRVICGVEERAVWCDDSDGWNRRLSSYCSICHGAGATYDNGTFVQCALSFWEEKKFCYNCAGATATFSE